MPIMLMPDQVPAFWEAIKYSVVSSNNIEKEHISNYLNRLLYTLLSGKSQCFARLDKERRLEAIAITNLATDAISDEKVLFVSCLYSFKKSPLEAWIEGMDLLKSFATEQNCKAITCRVVNEKAADLCKSLGMRHRSESLILNIGGD
jgi:hypothetical protein